MAGAVAAHSSVQKHSLSETLDKKKESYFRDLDKWGFPNKRKGGKCRGPVELTHTFRIYPYIYIYSLLVSLTPLI